MTANLEYYKVFYYVANTHSLTAAAEILNISQPAVSQSVRQLETVLGVKLFKRARHGVMLTKEGEALFAHVWEGYKAFENGERAVKEMLDLDAGEIVIGASDMSLRFFLLPFLEKFHEAYPNITIRVTNAPTPETVRNLRAGAIDFGVISTPFDSSDNIIVTPVKEIKDTFVAARKYIKYKNRTLDLKILEELPIISLEGETSSGKYMREFLDRKGITLKPEFELATSDMIVEFAVKNLGVGCVMREFASRAIEEGKLFELRFTSVLPGRHIALAENSGTTLSSAARKLLDMIKEDMKID